MHCVYAAGRQIADLERVLAVEKLDDVTIKPAFMGRAVVWCASDRSRDIVQAVVAARQTQAA